MKNIKGVSKTSLLSKTALGASCLALQFAIAAPGYAQVYGPEAPAPDQSVDQAGGAGAPAASSAADDIVVTGSRVSRPGNTSPNPVTSMGQQDLQLAAPRLFDSITQLPQFRNSSNTLGLQWSNTGFFLNLRNLGPSRMLVLIDGRRAPLSNENGSVDISMVPQSLVKRVDVITGGASAAYGSDAISGATNFILDTSYKGFKFDASAGVSTYGDAPSQRLSATFGTDFLEGRGRLIASADYSHQSMVGPESRDRSFMRNPPAVITSPPGVYPTRTLTNGVLSVIAPGGLITTVSPVAGATLTDANRAAMVGIPSRPRAR